jgi:ATP synthase protein I
MRAPRRNWKSTQERLEMRRFSPSWALGVAQAAVIVPCVALAWWMGGPAAGRAALFGGLVAFVPALYFAVRVGLYRGDPGARQVLGSFYQAELGKLLLTALLFFIGVKLFGSQFAPLMLTCVACLAMNWLVLAVARFD